MFKNNKYIYDRFPRSDNRKYKSTLGGTPLPMTRLDHICLVVDDVIDSFLNRLINLAGKVLKIQDLHKSWSGMYNYTIQFEDNRRWFEAPSIMWAFMATHKPAPIVRPYILCKRAIRTLSKKMHS